MTWQDFIAAEKDKHYYSALSLFLEKERSDYLVHPKKEEVFRAFELCPLEQTRVVILGQDPYPTPGHAHGLAFSVKQNVQPLPKSLHNIYKEVLQDTGVNLPSHGNLERWAEQGVLLLNTVLTVRSGSANSHERKGWEQFTDAAITLLNKQNQAIAFLLWGKNAQQKASLINNPVHHIFSAPHPSPLSAYRGFFGCKHFSKTNKWFKNNGLEEIKW
jgi:uracil-DNA glycosylase